MTRPNIPSQYTEDFPVGWVPQPRVNALSPERLRRLPPEQREKLAPMVEQFRKTKEINPLWDTYMRSQSHHEYASCPTLVGVCYAGNRYGKTSMAVLGSLINCVPMEWVPRHLMQYRRYLEDEPFFARITSPSLKDSAEKIIVPLLKRWVPRPTLIGGSWEKAYSKQNMMLRFKSGSFIELMSYDQDSDKHAGASRHGIWLDEPPPRDIWYESLARVTEYEGGFLRLGATMAKGIPSWFRREIHAKRKTSPHVSVYFGSIHDNDTVSAANKEAVLSMYSDKERKVREYGRLISLEGVVYDNFDRDKHMTDSIEPQQLKAHEGDIFIAIDPGIRNPAAVFGIANSLTEEVFIFEEVCPQMSTMSVEIFTDLIKERMEHWLIQNPYFIIDPRADQRQQGTGETLIHEFNRHDIWPEQGNNNKDIGIPRVNDMFHANKIFIAENCETLIDQLETWSWSSTLEDAKGNAKTEDGDDDCFVAGTLIETERGAVPVEEVTTDDKVLTRYGYFPVMVKHAREHEVGTITLEGGREITGTPEHPLWVNGEGFVPMDSIRYGDMIGVCPSLKRSSTTESTTTDIQSRPAANTGAISGLTTLLERGVLLTSTVKSGSITMEKSLTGGISTTLTATPQTTQSRTWNVSILSNMRRGTGRKNDQKPPQQGPTRYVLSLWRGTGQTQGGSGTRFRPKSPMRIVRTWLENAKNVATSTKRSILARRGFAQTNARPNGARKQDWMTLIEIAPSAEAPFGSINMPRHKLAGERVVGYSKAGRRPVYNLTVLGPPEYFANGILVHNCTDAFRYLVMALPWGGDLQKKREAPPTDTLESMLEHYKINRGRREAQAAYSV